MDVIQRLLGVSGDFLLITNDHGTILQVGDHLRRLLEASHIEITTCEEMISAQIRDGGMADEVTLDLGNAGIGVQSFRLLSRSSSGLVWHAPDTAAASSGVAQRQLSDERLHTLLDESSDPIFSFYRDGTYLYANKIFAQTLGYRQDEIIGKRLWDIFPQDEADRRYAMVEKTFVTGTTDTIEVKIPLPDGAKFFLTTVKPVFDDKKNVSYIICISKDITELRETQDQLTSLKGIIPICSHCKCMRDDAGAWQELEKYISHHSEAEFSHGICPECARQLYPTFADKFK